MADTDVRAGQVYVWNKPEGKVDVVVESVQSGQVTVLNKKSGERDIIYLTRFGGSELKCVGSPALCGGWDPT